MTNYVIYNVASKQVIGTFVCSEQSIIEGNIKDGQSFIEGELDYSRIECAKVLDGNIIYSKTVEQSNEEKNADIFKAMRNSLLAQSDWTQAPDGPLTDAKKAEWATYRQALRDLPSTTADPANPTWPTKPT